MVVIFCLCVDNYLTTKSCSIVFKYTRIRIHIKVKSLVPDTHLKWTGSTSQMYSKGGVLARLVLARVGKKTRLKC
jgi:hypothetical protein